MAEDENSIENLDSSAYAKKKDAALIGILVISALAGVAAVFVVSWPRSYLIYRYAFGLPELFFAFAWCHYDAAEREYFMTRGMLAGLVLLFPFAFPIYLFSSRGLAGFRALGMAILFFGLSLFMYVLVALATALLRHMLGF